MLFFNVTDIFPEGIRHLTRPLLAIFATKRPRRHGNYSAISTRSMVIPTCSNVSVACSGPLGNQTLLVISRAMCVNLGDDDAEYPRQPSQTISTPACCQSPPPELALFWDQLCYKYWYARHLYGGSVGALWGAHLSEIFSLHAVSRS